MSYSEDELIEQPAINLYSELGWQTLDCYSEVFGEDGTLGRDNRSEVPPRNRPVMSAKVANETCISSNENLT